MTNSSDDRSAIAAGFVWASRIMAVSLEMVLPGVLGSWLDRRWGTGFLAIVGFALGMVGGVWHLLLMVGATNGRKDRDRTKRSRPTNNDRDGDRDES